MIGLQPDAFRCQIPECDGSGASFSDFNSSIFPIEDSEPDYCSYYPVSNFTTNGTCYDDNFDYDGTPVECKSGDVFYYDDYEMDSTFVMEFDLVCDESFKVLKYVIFYTKSSSYFSKVALVGSIYMFGLLVSSFISGTLADKFGRKITLMLVILIGVIGAMSGAFAKTYPGYCVARFFTGVGRCA